MAIVKTLIVKGVARFLTDAYMSTIRSGIWNGSTIQVGYGGTGVTSAKGDLYTPVFLSSSGITPCTVAIPHNTKDFKINGTTYSIFTTYTGTAPTIFAPTSLAGTGGYILATNSAKTGLEWVAKPATNVTTSAVVAAAADGTTQISANQSDPYYNLLEGGAVTRSIQFKHGSNMTITSDANGVITFTSSYSNTWRGIYTGGTSRVGTGTGTKAMNFAVAGNLSVNYLAAGTGSGQSGSADYFTVKITANANAVDVAGYVAAPTATNNKHNVWMTNANGAPAWRAVVIPESTPTIGTSDTTLATIGGIIVKAKIGSYASSSHTHYYLVTSGDHRSDVTTPSDYSNKFTFVGLKNNSTLGISNAGTYSYLIGLRGWSDDSGGGSHELAFSQSLGLFRRQEGSSGWGSWKRIADSSNVVNNNISITWNSETTIATIAGVAIKVKIPSNPNTWRNIYTDGTSRVGTGTDTKAMNFASGNLTVSYLAAGTDSGQSGNANYFTIKLDAKNWTGATSETAGTAGYMPGATSTNRTKFLRGDGSWIALSLTDHTHSVIINGSTKTIAAPGGTAVDLGNYVPKIAGTGSVVAHQKSVLGWKGCKILIPGGFNPWMIAFTVRIYIGYAYTDIVFSGYHYGNNHWSSPAARVIGGTKNYKVVMGYEGDSANSLYVWIGNTDDVALNYGGITIMNLHAGHSDSPDWYTTWTISDVAYANLTNKLYDTTTVLPALSNHTHPLSIAADSGTNQLTLEASTKYKLTAGGSTYIFTTPPNTWIANAVDTAGYVAAPTAADNKHNVWMTNSDGVPAWRAVTAPATVPTLAWNTETSIGTVGGIIFKVKLPTNPNSDTKVTQNSDTANSSYRLLFKYTANNTNETNTVKYATTLTYNPSTKLLYNNGPIDVGSGSFNSLIKIFGSVSADTLKQSAYGLPSSWTAGGSNATDDFLKAWCKYIETNYAGKVILSHINPNSLGYVQAHDYGSGFVTQANIDSGGNYTNATLGAPVHINGHYYNHGGNEYIFGYSYGKWYLYNNLHSGNSSVSGGGNAPGDSITVKINGTSKTLTIPTIASQAISISVTKTLNVDSWTDVNGFTGAGTYAIQISCGDLYASGILSGCGGSDTVIDEVPLHVTNKGANTWRPYVRVNGGQIQMTTNEASPGTSRTYTIKILKLI